VTRKGFVRIVKSAFAGMGFPNDSPAAMEFPNEMFWPGSDLSPIEKELDKIVFGLTKWESTVVDTKIKSLPPITVEGRDYQEALNNMNLLFLKNEWSDGLPLLPATRERADWILGGTAIARNKVLGTMLPKASLVTVESVAVSLAMAGGRPEYMPVLLAAVEAFLDPASKHEHLQTTTGNNFPVVIVNGPIARQIRLGSGFGCCGPDPNHPSGSSIGRALRLLQMNVGGAVPGKGTMAEFGANRATNLVLAENEEGVPARWQTLSEERGFPRGSNTVTIHFVTGAIDMVPSTTSTKEAAIHTLNRWSAYIGCPFNMYWGFDTRWTSGSPGVVIMAPMTAQGLADAGYSKDNVREYLWEKTKLAPEKVKEFGFERHVAMLGADPSMPFPVSKTPGSLTIAIAGGASSGHALFLPNQGYCPVTKAIHLPGNARWEQLMQSAEAELGPLPSN
jgi:hypothetical protein